jgi:hypothetical protein
LAICTRQITRFIELYQQILEQACFGQAIF